MKLAQGHTTPGRLTPMSDSRETLSLFHRTVKQGGHKAPLVGVETCFAWGSPVFPLRKNFIFWCPGGPETVSNQSHHILLLNLSQVLHNLEYMIPLETSNYKDQTNPQLAWWGASSWWKARLLRQAVLKTFWLLETGSGKFPTYPKAGHLSLSVASLKTQGQPELNHCRYPHWRWLSYFQCVKWMRHWRQSPAQTAPCTETVFIQSTAWGLWHHSHMCIIKPGGGREGKLGDSSGKHSCSWFSSQSGLLEILHFWCKRCWWYIQNKLYTFAPILPTSTSLHRSHVFLTAHRSTYMFLS